MTRAEFELYVKELNVSAKLEKDYWSVYDRINEVGTPLNYSQRANILLAELRRIRNS
jgi:hypothetical protein